jgi:hypothetical protein
MIVKKLAELPEKYACKLCDAEKPIVEMVLVRLRKQKRFLLRPRCKACHNAGERGHRREYKTAYLRRWRKWHPELNESYWRQRAKEKRVETNARCYNRFIRNHAAILIQGRLRRRLGMTVSIAECRQLAKKFGCCYPTRYGLTPDGLRECERIRSRMRAAGQHVSNIEIRMMVYDDGYYIKPSRQRMPYRHAAEQLRRWHGKQRSSAAKAA